MPDVARIKKPALFLQGNQITLTGTEQFSITKGEDLNPYSSTNDGNRFVLSFTFKTTTTASGITNTANYLYANPITYFGGFPNDVAGVGVYLNSSGQLVLMSRYNNSNGSKTYTTPNLADGNWHSVCFYGATYGTGTPVYLICDGDSSYAGQNLSPTFATSTTRSHGFRNCSLRGAMEFQGVRYGSYSVQRSQSYGIDNASTSTAYSQTAPVDGAVASCSNSPVNIFRFAPRRKIYDNGSYDSGVSSFSLLWNLATSTLTNNGTNWKVASTAATNGWATASSNVAIDVTNFKTLLVNIDSKGYTCVVGMQATPTLSSSGNSTAGFAAWTGVPNALANASYGGWLPIDIADLKGNYYLSFTTAGSGASNYAGYTTLYSAYLIP